PGPADIGRRFGERERDTLEGADRLAERLAVARPLQRLVEGLLGSAETGEPDDRTGVVEALHDREEAGSFFPDECVGRDRGAVEVQRGPADGPAAEVVEGGTAHCGVVQVDPEGADATGARTAGAGKHDGPVRSHTEGDRGLLAVQRPAAAL